MTNEPFSIEPSTKVAALLERYPQLEDVLIGIAPPFKKLKNPLLRKSVAKVASLRQAAAVARLGVNELVNRLRAEVGQEPIASEDVGDPVSYLSSQPDWFDTAKIVASINEQETGDQDTMTLATVLQKAAHLQPTEIVELVTTFLPAPGIDVMRSKGFLVWSVQEDPELFKTYFSKPGSV